MVKSYVLSHDRILQRFVNRVDLLSHQDLILFQLMVKYGQLLDLSHFVSIKFSMVHFKYNPDLLNSHLSQGTIFLSVLIDALENLF
jgi:hypothetical protein